MYIRIYNIFFKKKKKKKKNKEWNFKISKLGSKKKKKAFIIIS